MTGCFPCAINYVDLLEKEELHNETAQEYLEVLERQSLINGGGLTPSQYWQTVIVKELAEDGVSVLNKWVLTEVWPTRVNGQELDRMSSDNSIEEIEFSVGTCDKL